MSTNPLKNSEHPAIEEIFGAEGLLARKLKGFEFRSGQIDMAIAVTNALTDPGNILAIEAGTGIGKTLAYLIPAILSRQKIIISTGTLNLQDQILHKEIPFIKKNIAPDFTALCVKGRQNYLCLYRWQQFLANPKLPLLMEDKQATMLHEWASETRTGDRAELFWLPDNSPLWHQMSATNTQCLGTQCPDYSNCFISRLRMKAARTDILIVNHHLFFSDLALRRFGHAEVLPRYESVLFDEAHHLENVATQYFGKTFSHYQLIDLVLDIEKTAQTELPKKDRNTTVQLARALSSQADLFTAIFPKDRGRFPLQEIIENVPAWHTEVESLKQRITSLCEHLENLLNSREIWGTMLRRCSDLLTNLYAITEEMTSSHVYWFERRDKTIVLSASPIEVASDLQEHLYTQVRSTVFTSATLSTGGDFSYFRERLGLHKDIETVTIPSPFDYANRTMLYVPGNNFPAPNSPLFLTSLQQSIHNILLASDGRALVLCTSFKSMNSLFEFLKERLPFPVYVQGSAPKSILLESFQHDTHSVLLAVASFWEGVDVPGETLSCVIIDKLPFEVPSDPVMMARINKIKEEGGNPFFDFQIPRAILTLRQGIGRLMRSSEDKGLLAIMDTRLFTKSYGKTFLKSLPASPVTRSLDAVEQFFSREE